MTAYTYSYTLKLFYSALLDGLPESFRIPSGTRPFSYLLTGLLTDLLTEGNFITYGPTYGPTYGIVLPRSPTR